MGGGDHSPELVYGFHAVTAALKEGKVAHVWIQAGRDDARVAALLSLAAGQGLRVERVSRQELERRAPGGRAQGVVAQLLAAPAPAAQEHLDDLVSRLGQALLLLVLDGVQDPHNLGACLRTADAAGVHAVIAPKDRAAGLTPTVRKVASGAAEALPVYFVTNLARTLRGLQEQGVWIVGTSDRGTVDLFDADLRGPLALVLGAEGSGLRRLTGELCDVLLRIPMIGVVESLNVSVAAGVCLFEAVRQRRPGGHVPDGTRSTKQKSLPAAP